MTESASAGGAAISEQAAAGAILLVASGTRMLAAGELNVSLFHSE